MAEKKDRAPTMVDAINRALHEAMDSDETIVVIGEDVGTNGGVFRVTAGLKEQFGKDRVIDAPLAESGIIGFSIGMAMNGLKPVAEMQFSGFSYYALAQIENHAARMRWRTRGAHSVPMVIRMPYGAGVRALEHHSESREAFFAHIPGLKIVIPATPARAYALTHAAIRDPDPVIVMEPKAVYRTIREDIDGIEPAEIGVSRTVREGGDLTIVSYGAMLHRALEAAESLAADGIDTDVIDVETISPLDAAPIAASVEKTGRLLIVNEAPPSFGPAGEIAMRVMEESFYSLHCPIRRICGWDIHVPFFAREQAYLPSVDRIVRAARDMITD
ncbi:alpha-ketoacid dehydrogenase subunit beta [Ruegeria marina]|uniref:Pyruvate dehydrogenase E1 component beta subunit n=1 Tax=Ruegeria marina TaxID=639004 RepID=A0A1G6UYD4_9RHOB|nr:alpha-ketoacid dehydrogenase subunit beta [Ruegeria marina]SDD46263.1 pyruvate dehydrogenase E1 component beta subunit [Ruegeria marina]